MAGYVRGSKAHKQVMVGMISKDLQALHAKAPQAHDEIVRLSRDISHIINVYMLGNTEHQNKNLFEARLQEDQGRTSPFPFVLVQKSF